MAKVEHKKAGKDYPDQGIKKGDMYYTWSPGFRGPTMRSKTPPRPSQLTANDFLVAYYQVVEAIEDAMADARDPAKPVPTAEECGSMRDGWVSDLENARDELQDKFDNMPEGFQEGETGQTMQERIEAAESFIGELEGVDFEYEESDLPEGADEEDKLDAMREHFQNKFQECLDGDPGI